MANSIKGIIAEISGDTTKLQTALRLFVITTAPYRFYSMDNIFRFQAKTGSDNCEAGIAMTGGITGSLGNSKIFPTK